MSKDKTAAPAIPLETLMLRIEEYCLNARAGRLGEHDEEFGGLRFRCRQMYYFYNYATTKLPIPISIRAMMGAFGGVRDRDYDCDRVTHALAHVLEPAENRGCHQTFDDDIERGLLLWIQENAARNSAVTGRDVREHIATRYHLSVTRDWINSFLGRHLDELCLVKSAPQETELLEVPRCFLEETIRCLHESVQGRPTELVFNLDEVGISDWEDRKSKKVIVPQSMRVPTIHHRVNRAPKHVSVIACISAAGESLTAYIVTSQDSPTLREQLKKRGVRCAVCGVRCAFWEGFQSEMMCKSIYQCRNLPGICHDGVPSQPQRAAKSRTICRRRSRSIDGQCFGSCHVMPCRVVLYQ
jgi:hypothetical protein